MKLYCFQILLCPVGVVGEEGGAEEAVGGGVGRRAVRSRLSRVAASSEDRCWRPAVRNRVRA